MVGRRKGILTGAQTVADLNAIGAQLEATYPKDNDKMSFVLSRSTLGGDAFERPVHAFVIGLMVLATLILVAACVNLGSLFAARAADRAREMALRLALGAGSGRILRQLFTEAVLIALVGGAIGLAGSVLLLDWLATWRPFPQFAINLPIEPDATRVPRRAPSQRRERSALRRGTSAAGAAHGPLSGHEVGLGEYC